MPEGHTLHRAARLHQRCYVGEPVAVSSPQGRFADAAALVDGRVMERVEAYGKHLFHVYGRDLVVHVHLGLYGAFIEGAPPVRPPVGQIRMRMVGATHWTDLRGPTACELFTDVQVAALRSRLGPDPLRADADPDQAWTAIHRSRAPIATLLLDQSVIAGVGNVYRAEALFRQRVDPLLPGADLDPDQWAAMWADLVAIMSDGVRDGRIITLRPEHDPRRLGRPIRTHRRRSAVGYVYRRTGEPCLVCGTPVAAAELAGRMLYWCPHCQQRPVPAGLASRRRGPQPWRA